jgi:hypothetical protein
MNEPAPEPPVERCVTCVNYHSLMGGVQYRSGCAGKSWPYSPYQRQPSVVSCPGPLCCFSRWHSLHRRSAGARMGACARNVCAAILALTLFAFGGTAHPLPGPTGCATMKPSDSCLLPSACDAKLPPTHNLSNLSALPTPLPSLLSPAHVLLLPLPRLPPPVPPMHHPHSHPHSHLTRAEQVAEAMNRKLSPNMRDRIRKALHRSLLDSEYTPLSSRSCHCSVSIYCCCNTITAAATAVSPFTAAATSSLLPVLCLASALPSHRVASTLPTVQLYPHQCLTLSPCCSELFASRDRATKPQSNHTRPAAICI